MTNKDNNKDNVIQLFDNEADKPILFGITECSITDGIAHLVNTNVFDEMDINVMLLKHMKNTDDNKHPEDIEYNLQAIKSGSGRVLSIYNIKGHRIYINSYIAHVGGNALSKETTVMLADEY